MSEYSDAQLKLARLALKKAVKLYAKEKDILNWGRLLFPQKFSMPFCSELHDYFIDIRDEEYTSTLAPRGTAKTTIKCFLIPFFLALEEPEKYQHFINVQNTTTKAIAINVAIKTECEENKLLNEIYGEYNSSGVKTLVTSRKWSEKQFVLPNGVVFGCLGAGESVRGINYRSMRPDYIIVDDLYNEDDINNVQSIQKKTNWFWGSLYPARASHKHCCVHVQGTAIHETDLMHSLSHKSRWKFKKFQAIKNYDTKEVLWKENPAKTFEALLKDKEDMGSIIFEREMQNNCRDDETSIIKQSWIKYYKHSELMQTGKKLIKICGLDPACGEKKLNDFSGYATIHYDENYNVYIEAVKEAKNSFNENLNMVDSWNDRYNPYIFAIEAISGFKQLTSEVKRTKNVRLKEVTTVSDKISRLEAQSFRFENGKVYINIEMNEKERDNLVEQLINNYPLHDDVRDAVIIAMEQIATQRGTKVRRM